jgi:hypothetical protein
MIEGIGGAGLGTPQLQSPQGQKSAEAASSSAISSGNSVIDANGSQAVDHPMFRVRKGLIRRQMSRHQDPRTISANVVRCWTSPPKARSSNSLDRGSLEVVFRYRLIGSRELKQ